MSHVILGSAHYCCISIALAMDIVPSCPKSLIYHINHVVLNHVVQFISYQNSFTQPPWNVYQWLLGPLLQIRSINIKIMAWINNYIHGFYPLTFQAEGIFSLPASVHLFVHAYNCESKRPLFTYLYAIWIHYWKNWGLSQHFNRIINLWEAVWYSSVT